MHVKFSGWILAAMVLLSLAARPAQAQADTTLDTTDYIVDIFDTRSTSTPWWGYWFTFTDRNSKTADSLVLGNSYLTTHDSISGNPLLDTVTWEPIPQAWPIGPSGDSLDRALRMGFVLGDRPLSCGGSCTYAPYVGLGLGFTTQGGRFLNLRGATSLSFYAKADSGTIIVNVGVTDTNTKVEDYSQRFTIDNTWKKYTITLTASTVFKQPDYGTHGPFDKTAINGMVFGINKGDNALRPANGLSLDSIKIENWKFIDPIPPVIEEPISVRGALAAAAHGFKVARVGDVLRVRVPSALNGKSGLVEAVNASGKVLGRASFGNSGEFEMRVEGSTKGVYFRVITAAIRR